ncbi:TIR domain-containing protein [Paenibacillus nicotianae]|uniref:TIR domain-containing protein n=1 Tax=Paenibacillus nicotianae TaxID=1526551 RepID=A0ABW4UUF2_9BACL
MHKTFISYHHDNDQDLKNMIVEKFGSNDFIDKSVKNGDINPNNTENTIMRTIREKFLKDLTVTLVLVGSETSQRPFINSEIQASLWGENPAGLLAVVRDEIYQKIYLETTCKNLNCNCGIKLRTQTKLFEDYLPELIFKNNKFHKPVAHYDDDQVYCSIVKISTFMRNPEKYIDDAFRKRKTIPIAYKKLSKSTPKIQNESLLFSSFKQFLIGESK